MKRYYTKRHNSVKEVSFRESGIHKLTGFRVKSGMTNWKELASLCMGYLKRRPK